jgi:hypothetical protein
VLNNVRSAMSAIEKSGVLDFDKKAETALSWIWSSLFGSFRGKYELKMREDEAAEVSV